MGYDPTQAPEPTKTRFKNTVVGVANEIITLQEAVDRKRFRVLPEGANPNEPYWDLHYEALDAKFADGARLPVHSGTKLFDKNGKRLDNKQRPFHIARAFAGLTPPIAIFPGDPTGRFDDYCRGIGQEPIGAANYDASKFIGRVFTVEAIPAEELKTVGRPYITPLVAHPDGYVFTGQVREVTRRDDSGGDSAPSQPVTVDFASNPAAQQRVAQCLAGHKTGEDLFDVLRSEGIDGSVILNGESLLSVALDGRLPDVLGALGIITVVGDEIQVATPAAAAA